ncbi:hypothetical protein [Mesorhizobium sp. B2-7-1]|uniref:hypothetical protein n=1 Tax=Mesorhizobium sp. B2-7-1 TaxID=2589909 RepID=UPI00112E56BB|nr:hypothetical protein [Mesorhizobium sp. B2-7-1]TPJ73050.1 hypothetical protein FJ471_05295 [Mesorhizobium sp. B2-7-1]
MKNGVTTIRLDDLIEAALTNKPYNQQRFGREVERYSRRISKARAPDLPDDLHADIAQEALALLFKAGAAVLATDTGKAALRKAVLKAVRIVRASFAPPGQRTRPAPVDRTRVMAGEQTRVAASAKPASIAAEHVGRVVDAGAIERATVGEGLNRAIDFDRLEHPDATAAVKQVEDRMEIDFILGQAPSLVARSLRFIHIDDEPVELVASAAHLSRFALNRQVKAFLSAWRLAA